MLDLPDCLLREVYVEWLLVKDLCMIDTAVQSKEQRKRFLDILANETVVMDGQLVDYKMSRRSPPSPESATVSDVDYLRWLSKRNLSIKRIQFTKADHVIFSLANCICFISDKCFHTLEELNMSSCTYVNDLFLLHIVLKCKNLKNLILDGCEDITDDSMTGIAENCKELVFLDISNCLGLTQPGILYFIKECHTLKCLQAYSCDAFITDEVIVQLAENCPDIEKLDLGMCHELTDNSIIKLV